MTPRNVVLEGDALKVLRTLAPASVDAVVTSPPYFRARRYDAGPAELGQEPDVDGWVASLRALSREIARVLVPTGSYWLNVGDLSAATSDLAHHLSRCYWVLSGWVEHCLRMAGWSATKWPG
jgi:DNA modification methylase